MTLTELITRYRNDTSDLVAPYLCDDTDITAYANEAVHQACRRAKLLIDSTTTAQCRITLIANQSVYPLDAKVLEVRSARVEGRGYPLDLITERTLEQYKPGWMSEVGTIKAAVTDLNARSIRFYRTPDAAQILLTPYAWMNVVRLPLTDMTTGTNVPEIAAHHHLGLVNWMKFRAYSSGDPDLIRADLAGKHYELFEAEFGPIDPAVIPDVLPLVDGRAS